MTLSRTMETYILGPAARSLSATPRGVCKAILPHQLKQGGREEVVLDQLVVTVLRSATGSIQRVHVHLTMNVSRTRLEGSLAY